MSFERLLCGGVLVRRIGRDRHDGHDRDDRRDRRDRRDRLRNGDRRRGWYWFGLWYWFDLPFEIRERGTAVRVATQAAPHDAHECRR